MTICISRIDAPARDSEIQFKHARYIHLVRAYVWRGSIPYGSMLRFRQLISALVVERLLRRVTSETYLNRGTRRSERTIANISDNHR